MMIAPMPEHIVLSREGSLAAWVETEELKTCFGGEVCLAMALKIGIETKCPRVAFLVTWKPVTVLAVNVLAAVLRSAKPRIV